MLPSHSFYSGFPEYTGSSTTNKQTNMPRSSSHRSPSVSYSRESSVFDPPVYTIYSGSDHVLQFDPPVGSKELAVAMSYHFPGEGSLDAMMRAAVKKHLREERRSRESSKSDSRGRSTNGRLPTPQSEEKHRINRSSAPRLSEQTQPPPLPPRVSVFKSDEPDSTSSGKRGSRRAVSSHVDNSDRKSSHRNDAPHYPADADADERPARPSYGTCLGVPSSSNSRTSKSADSHRRRRADSSGDESDLRILAWNPEVQGFKEKQKKRRYEKEEREQVRANRGHACEDHRKRRVKVCLFVFSHWILRVVQSVSGGASRLNNPKGFPQATIRTLSPLMVTNFNSVTQKNVLTMDKL